MMDRYVLGFAFTEDDRLVAMIKKDRPAWQRGLLNGIGGKIERFEAPSAAMSREFLEETGVLFEPSKWRCAGAIVGEGYHVKVFTLSHRDVRHVTTMESEEVSLVPVNGLTGTVGNVPALIELCRILNSIPGRKAPRFVLDYH